MAEPPDDELVDVYDDSLKKVGVATRNEAHRKGLWHLNLHCWVVTKRKGGAVVFQVRSEDKSTFSGLLDSTVGGHFKAGEQLEDVAREIKEEIGLVPDVKVGKHQMRSVECVGFDDVGTGLQVHLVDSRHHIRPRLDDVIGEIFQVRPAVIGDGHARLQQLPHRTVKYEYA